MDRILNLFRKDKKNEERKEFLKCLFNFIKKNEVRGDYCEFGVYRGGTFAEAYKIAEAKELDMTFWAFDSFEGLPEDSGVFKKGTYKASKELFLRNFVKLVKPNKDNVKVIDGWFKDTLPNIKIDKIALAYVDCDIYSSTKEVLNFIAKSLQKNSILVLDDFHYGKGEREAFEEWLLEKNIKVEKYRPYSWKAESFIVK